MRDKVSIDIGHWLTDNAGVWMSSQGLLLNVIFLMRHSAFPGMLANEDGTPLDEKVLAMKLRMAPREFQGAMANLLLHGVLKKNENNVIYYPRLIKFKQKVKPLDEDAFQVPENVRARFDEVWAKYPRRIGKNAALVKFYRTVKTDQDFDNIKKALDNYIQYLERNKVEDKYIKHGSTFFNNWQDYVDFKVGVADVRNAQKEMWKLQGKSTCHGALTFNDVGDDGKTVVRCSACRMSQ